MTTWVLSLAIRVDGLHFSVLRSAGRCSPFCNVKENGREGKHRGLREPIVPALPGQSVAVSKLHPRGFFSSKLAAEPTTTSTTFLAEYHFYLRRNAPE
jgi:hypothetical protein